MFRAADPRHGSAGHSAAPQIPEGTFSTSPITVTCHAKTNNARQLPTRSTHAPKARAGTVRIPMDKFLTGHVSWRQSQTCTWTMARPLAVFATTRTLARWANVKTLPTSYPSLSRCRMHRPDDLREREKSTGRRTKMVEPRFAAWALR